MPVVVQDGERKVRSALNRWPASPKHFSRSARVVSRSSIIASHLAQSISTQPGATLNTLGVLYMDGYTVAAYYDES